MAIEAITELNLNRAWSNWRDGEKERGTSGGLMNTADHNFSTKVLKSQGGEVG
jgi:hypothetical protein